MSSFVIEGTLTVDISGLEGLAGEIRSVSIKALQGEIRKVADQILRELVEKDWPAGRASPGYVSTGELVDAINVTGGGTSLSIEMDGSRMSMSPPSTGNSANGDWGGIESWGIHMSVQSQPFNDEMPAYLNYGGGGLVPHQGTHYFDNAFFKYVEIIPKLLADALRAAGFEVSGA